MTLYLSREGIFPITTSIEGTSLPTQTGLAHSGTIQGEGKLCGTAALFVRLQGCNLRCRWTAPDGTTSHCDTAHTWSNTQTNAMTVDDVTATIDANIGKMRHVVITGGEPFLQAEALCLLADNLHQMGLHITVETNGSLEHEGLTSRTDLLSLSPKLSASGTSQSQRLETASAVAKSIRTAQRHGHDVQLKFVVASPSDETEILNDYAEALSLVEPQDVIVMPLGATNPLLAQSTPLAVSMAVRNGWRFGPRLHISIFGNKEGT